MNMKQKKDYPYSILCSNCEYEFNNGPSNQIILKAGNYCPQCGEQINEEDYLTKKEFYQREGIQMNQY